MFKLNKKVITVSTLSLTLLCGGLVVGCTTKKNDNSGSNSQVEAPVKEINFRTLEEDINNSNLLTFKSMTMPVKDFPAFVDIQDKIEDGLASRAMISTQFQDIVVVKTSDVKATTDALNSYLKSDAVRPFADGYGGEENISTVQDAKVGSVGDYVYLVAAPHSEDIEELILNALK